MTETCNPDIYSFSKKLVEDVPRASVLSKINSHLGDDIWLECANRIRFRISSVDIVAHHICAKINEIGE